MGMLINNVERNKQHLGILPLYDDMEKFAMKDDMYMIIFIQDVRLFKKQLLAH